MAEALEAFEITKMGILKIPYNKPLPEDVIRGIGVTSNVVARQERQRTLPVRRDHVAALEYQVAQELKLRDPVWSQNSRRYRQQQESSWEQTDGLRQTAGEYLPNQPWAR